jgi:hypothetical protein
VIAETNYFKECDSGTWTLPDGGVCNGVSYSKDIDFEFVLALATIGSVNITSHQVTLHVSGSSSMKRLKVPANAVLEWCSANAGEMMLRFRFEQREGGAK